MPKYINSKREPKHKLFNFDFDNYILILIIIFYLCYMVVITKTKLIVFYETEPTAKEPLLKWYNTVLKCDWNDINNIKQTYNSVDYIGNDRYVFNISGNKYRIVEVFAAILSSPASSPSSFWRNSPSSPSRFSTSGWAMS